MTEGIVVDASVALKWVLPEEGSDAAAELLDGRPLYAPELMMIECANALWVAARRGSVVPDAEADALHVLRSAPFAPRPTDFDPVPEAFRLARQLDHPVYDCVYLALAAALEVPVITADRRFADAVNRGSPVGVAVRLLGS